MRLINLKCEYSITPIGVGTRSPRFSWELQTEEETHQIGYRLRIVDDSHIEIADTGTVYATDQLVKTPELPLAIQSVYHWTLTVFLSNGSCLEETSFFETSFFSAKDWIGDWVTPVWVHTPPEKQSVTFLRGEFQVHGLENVKRARVYVGATTGLHGNMTARMNMYRFRVNGKAASDEALNPGQLSPRRGRGLIRAYDLESLLEDGNNAVGLIYISAKISIRILIEYKGGRIDHFSMKNGRWVTRPRGPFLRLWAHDILEYDGKSEHYDAREEFTGWDRPGFQPDKNWRDVSTLGASPDILAPQALSVSPYSRSSVKSLERRSDGRFIADFGENRNGFARIRTKGARGTMIRLNYSEAIADDGSIDPISTFSAQMEVSIHHDIYWKKTDEPEWYEPSFAAHGFRYVEIIGMPELNEDDLEAVYLMSAVNAGFEFHCSDKRVQELMDLCVRSCQSNLMSIPTDCPTRERLGWGADAGAVSRFECAIFDTRLFYEKWFNDIADDQNIDGSLQVLAPFAIPLSSSSIPWAHGYVALAMDAWEHYGDLSFVAQAYEIFQRFAEYLVEIEESDGLSRRHCAFGDHFSRDNDMVSRDFLENAHASRCLKLISQFAKILGKYDEAKTWREHAEKRIAAINHNLRNGISYGMCTQSEAVHALAFHIAPAADRPALFDWLREQLTKEGIRTGYLGTELLTRVLEEENCPELAWTLLTSNALYSWRHWLDIGLTTAPEMWCPDLKIKPKTSLNHPALCGGIASWMIRGLAGIRPLEPGYRKVLVKPYFPAGVDEISVKLPTPRGMIIAKLREDNIQIKAPSGTEIITDNLPK